MALQEPGYAFVPAGESYITHNCKKRSKAIGKLVYIIRREGKQLGLQVPQEIYASVQKLEALTRAARHGAVFQLDAMEKVEARECILRLYPLAPAGDVEAILRRPWKRSSAGRLSHWPKPTLEGKTNYAVREHVQYRYSCYERIVNEERRKLGLPGTLGKPLLEPEGQELEVQMVLDSWRGPQVSAQRITEGQPTQKIMAPKSSQDPKTMDTRQAPPGVPKAAQAVGVLAPIRNSGLTPIEHKAPGGQQTRQKAKVPAWKVVVVQREAAERLKMLQMARSTEEITSEMIAFLEEKKQRALETLQYEADGYKYETLGERRRRREAIQTELKKNAPEGESGISKITRRTRLLRRVEKVLKEPVNGFILETNQERVKRIREAKDKEEGRESGTPGDSSIELTPTATTSQIIVINDSDSEHRDSPMEISSNDGDGDREWSDFGDGSVQRGGGGDSEYIASHAEGGRGGGGGEVEREVEEAEGGGGEEGDGSGGVIVVTVGGGTGEPPRAGLYHDANKSLMGNPRNETFEAEPPATKPIDSEAHQIGLKSLQNLAAKWQAIRKLPQQA